MYFYFNLNRYINILDVFIIYLFQFMNRKFGVVQWSLADKYRRESPSHWISLFTIDHNLDKVEAGDDPSITIRDRHARAF